MKRDFDLIRKILLIIEDDLAAGHTFQLPDFLSRIPGYDVDQLTYNLDLMIKAGLIEGEAYGYPIQIVAVSGLTWTAHDFLDNARNETVWADAKSKLIRMGGSVSLDVLKELLIQSARSVLGYAMIRYFSVSH